MDGTIGASITIHTTVVAHHIEKELDGACKSGAVRDIIIPVCPEQLRQLQLAMGRGVPDIDVLDRIASADVAMAVALIRQANSPLYALAQPVYTARQALVVLGARSASQLLSGFLVRQALHVRSAVLEHFWETSTRRALACEYIGQQLYAMHPGMAYSFGLFCHVGIPVMLGCVRGYGDTIAQAMIRKDNSLTQTENERHRTDHAVVGALVARTWLLPREVSVAVRLHHDLTCLADPRFTDTVRNLVALGQVADYLVQAHEEACDLNEWSRHGATCLTHLQIGCAEVDAWMDELHPVFEAVQFA